MTRSARSSRPPAGRFASAAPESVAYAADCNDAAIMSLYARTRSADRSRINQRFLNYFVGVRLSRLWRKYSSLKQRMQAAMHARPRRNRKARRPEQCPTRTKMAQMRLKDDMTAIISTILPGPQTDSPHGRHRNPVPHSSPRCTRRRNPAYARPPGSRRPNTTVENAD